jgi:hypothetical protein
VRLPADLGTGVLVGSDVSVALLKAVSSIDLEEDSFRESFQDSFHDDVVKEDYAFSTAASHLADHGSCICGIMLLVKLLYSCDTFGRPLPNLA